MIRTKFSKLKFFFFYLGFTQHKAEQPIQTMQLKGKEDKDDAWSGLGTQPHYEAPIDFQVETVTTQ